MEQAKFSHIFLSCSRVSTQLEASDEGIGVFVYLAFLVFGFSRLCYGITAG